MLSKIVKKLFYCSSTSSHSTAMNPHYSLEPTLLPELGIDILGEIIEHGINTTWGFADVLNVLQLNKLINQYCISKLGLMMKRKVITPERPVDYDRAEIIFVRRFIRAGYFRDNKLVNDVYNDYVFPVRFKFTTEEQVMEVFDASCNEIDLFTRKTSYRIVESKRVIMEDCYRKSNDIGVLEYYSEFSRNGEYINEESSELAYLYDNGHKMGKRVTITKRSFKKHIISLTLSWKYICAWNAQESYYGHPEYSGGEGETICISLGNKGFTSVIISRTNIRLKKTDILYNGFYHGEITGSVVLYIIDFKRKMLQQSYLFAKGNRKGTEQLKEFLNLFPKRLTKSDFSREADNE